jgi:hypothetical protein
VRFFCSGQHWLPNHCRHNPDADQDPPASCDGYSNQHSDLHTHAYQHGNQHPCADANSKPHGHPDNESDGHTRVYRHATACKYTSSTSHADPCGTSYKYTRTSAIRGL